MRHQTISPLNNISTLLPVFGDQLSLNLPSLQVDRPEQCCVLMAEVMGEANYVSHHRRKLVFVFASMRHFAEELRSRGWQVRYVELTHPENSGSLDNEIERAVNELNIKQVAITRPGEWRLDSAISKTAQDLERNNSVIVKIHEDSRFLCTNAEFVRWAGTRKQLRMEYFYRDMRRKTGLLMDDNKPIGGKWNYDAENRKPPGKDLTFHSPKRFRPTAITRAVIDMVETLFPDNFGSTENFWFATSRKQATAALVRWIEHSLPLFGDYQDAMLQDEPFMFHSVIAQYINIGWLDPMDVCQRVEAEYNKGSVPLNAAEGFIRQIIGWREYVRGIYWLKMPDYIQNNFFNATRALPEFYWTAETNMNCLRQCIKQTHDEAYAHHIQRLMVTGNFAMLIGVLPKEVHEWYLAVYADAYEWVELPNTLGMSQFADGGLLGSKPYAAGGNYINKMSNYCKHCHYKVSKKEGDDACPFNYLYWHFLASNRGKLADNHRLIQIYRTYDRMSDEKRQTINKDSEKFLSNLS